MPTCRHGHLSATEDYCDECGTPIATLAPETTHLPAPPAPPSEACPVCGTPRSGRFCEEDGYDFVLAPPVETPPAPPDPDTPAPDTPSQGVSGVAPLTSGASNATHSIAGEGTAATGWVVDVEADERWFAIVAERRGPDFARVIFPQYYPSTTIPLAGAEMRIGRVRGTPGHRPPEIDLTGPPVDPGVSRLHAVLLAGEEGWSVLDPGSTNGTSINYAEEPIAVDTAVALVDGDRIHVGAYTTLRLHRA